MKPTGNLMVVLEETGGNPEEIVVVTVRRDNICAIVAGDVKPKAHLRCADGKIIHSIAFASFGNPTGSCGKLAAGSCHSPAAMSIAEKVSKSPFPSSSSSSSWSFSAHRSLRAQACVGKNSCELPVSREAYAADAGCAGTTNTLAVQAKCVRKKGETA